MLKNVQEIMSGDVTHAAVWLWFEELSEAEASAIHTRVQSDPKYREDLDGLLAVFASMEALADERRVEAIARDYRHLLRERRMNRRFALGMAAGLLLAIGASLAVFLPGPGDRALPMYFTRIGEQQTIELADGSAVTLNTGSQLVVDYSESARRVLLQRGEAFFEVVDDPQRAFTVDLGLRSVTAMGTVFNVRKDPGRYQVAVMEGAVAVHKVTADGRAAVSASSGLRRVEAGWVAEFDVSRNELTASQPESMDRYRNWRSGLLSFYDEPLSQVVEELNRYTRRKILIEEASVMEWPVYTAIRVTEIDAALKALEQALPIRVTQHYDRIVITASGADRSEEHEPKR